MLLFLSSLHHHNHHHHHHKSTHHTHNSSSMSTEQQQEQEQRQQQNNSSTCSNRQRQHVSGLTISLTRANNHNNNNNTLDHTTATTTTTNCASSSDMMTELSEEMSSPTSTTPTSITPRKSLQQQQQQQQETHQQNSSSTLAKDDSLKRSKSSLFRLRNFGLGGGGGGDRSPRQQASNHSPRQQHSNSPPTPTTPMTPSTVVNKSFRGLAQLKKLLRFGAFSTSPRSSSSSTSPSSSPPTDNEQQQVQLQQFLHQLEALQFEQQQQQHLSVTAPTTTTTTTDHLSQYKDVVNRLSKMAIMRHPTEADYSSLQFLAKSSSNSCQLYSCHSASNLTEQYVMKVTLLRSRDVVIRVESELYLTSLCHHPNILSYVTSYASDDQIFMVTRYCSRGTLSQLMETFNMMQHHQTVHQQQQQFWNGTDFQVTHNEVTELNERQIAYICHQLLSALDYLHTRALIMHLDVKSDNILIDEHFNFMLSDFGLSHKIEHVNERFNDLRGTPHWLSPEMLTDTDYDSKVDIYSFGVVVWQMMHQGRVPHYKSRSVADILDRVKFAFARMEIGHQWSRLLVDFMYRAMEKNPSERWTASQLLNHAFIVQNYDPKVTGVQLFGAAGGGAGNGAGNGNGGSSMNGGTTQQTRQL